MPNALGHPDNYIEANPLATPAHIVPEWYFLPFYAMLRAITFDIGPIDSKLGGVIVMFGSLLIWFVVPWLDRSRVRSMRYRPIAKQCFLLLIATFIFLGWLGGKPAEQPYVLMAQLGTAYYFIYFLVILPALTIFETPSPMPKSIAESVLKKSDEPAGAGAAAPQAAE